MFHSCFFHTHFRFVFVLSSIVSILFPLSFFLFFSFHFCSLLCRSIFPLVSFLFPSLLFHSCSLLYRFIPVPMSIVPIMLLRFIFVPVSVVPFLFLCCFISFFSLSFHSCSHVFCSSVNPRFISLLLHSCHFLCHSILVHLFHFCFYFCRLIPIPSSNQFIPVPFSLIFVPLNQREVERTDLQAFINQTSGRRMKGKCERNPVKR